MTATLRIAQIAITECRDNEFGHATLKGKSAQQLVAADEIPPEKAAYSIRNKYACDASKGMHLLSQEEAERNDPKDFKAALDALEAACIAFLYA